MRHSQKFARFGKFSPGTGKQFDGELRVAGKDSWLCLWADHRFDFPSPDFECITGTLRDLTKVTLINCVVLEEGSGSPRRGEAYYFVKLFPHFVLEGDHHIAPTDKSVSGTTVLLDDAAVLFHDATAFGIVIDSAPYMEPILAASNPTRPLRVGPDPRIAYFTGKREILDAATPLGHLRVEHNPAWDLGGPSGVRIDNTISLTLATPQLISFPQTIARTARLLRFFHLVVGRPQKVRDSFILEADRPLKLHWSYSPARNSARQKTKGSPSAGDLLLDPIYRQKEFIDVMRAWFDLDQERDDARQRFASSFALQRSYSVERLIGAANMFDILPDSATPKDVELSKPLQEAKQQCREILEPLPESYERSSLLSALGRIGKASLKHKTRHRAEYLTRMVGDRFPDIVRVLDAAVDCRNHYVHGSRSKIDYTENFHLVVFFTDTLEFIFGASELLEAGWDIRTFLNTPTSMSHPYGAYRVHYQDNLRAFRALLDAASAS